MILFQKEIKSGLEYGEIVFEYGESLPHVGLEESIYVAFNNCCIDILLCKDLPSGVNIRNFPYEQYLISNRFERMMDESWIARNIE